MQANYTRLDILAHRKTQKGGNQERSKQKNVYCTFNKTVYADTLTEG